jgi:hypothetical protein
MTRWRDRVPGLLGPELASARLPIHLLLRRNRRRKCGTSHPESRLTSQLLNHLLLQLLQKVLWEVLFPLIQHVGLTGIFYYAGLFFFTSTVVEDPAGYLSRLLHEGS